MKHAVGLLLLVMIAACTTRRATDPQAALDGEYAPSHTVYHKYMLSQFGPKLAKEEDARWTTDRTRMRIEGRRFVITHGTNVSAFGTYDVQGDFLLFQGLSGANTWYQPVFKDNCGRLVFGPGWEWERIGAGESGLPP